VNKDHVSDLIIVYVVVVIIL